MALKTVQMTILVDELKLTTPNTSVIMKSVTRMLIADRNWRITVDTEPVKQYLLDAGVWENQIIMDGE